jgi:hypothetical protein
MRKDSHFTILSWFTAAIVAILSVAMATGGELALTPKIMNGLNQVLRASDFLHKSLVSKDEEQIELGLRDILVELDRTRVTSIQAKPHERRHLVRIINTAHEQFEQTRTTFGEERRQRLEEAYNQLVNIVRIYRVDRTYGIFFCAKDRTTWIQTGNRPQNPFRAISDGGHRESCGMRVPR